MNVYSSSNLVNQIKNGNEKFNLIRLFYIWSVVESLAVTC